MNYLSENRALFSAIKNEVREYFIFESRKAGCVICPMYDWSSNFPEDNSLYHETMGRRVLHIEVDQDALCEDDSNLCQLFFSNIGIDNEIEYLKVYLHRIPSDWISMWQIRVRWLNSVASQKDIEEFAESFVS